MGGRGILWGAYLKRKRQLNIHKEIICK